MSRPPKPPFTLEDRQLWHLVAQTTEPMDAKRGDQLRADMEALMGQAGTTGNSFQTPRRYRPPVGNTPAAPHKQTVAKQASGFVSHPIEEPVYKKLGKGRLSVDSRIDLHGMTQDRARFALLDFLQMAQQADDRIVLVITGKGNEGTGVLRRNVPQWLDLPQFRSLVNGTRPAHASHGGEGAMYVRVRKPRARVPHSRTR
ncbi:Smr/MutS family protein [Ahrensia sp. R2A130]|uniref:Smr/MutS family protein n=1 Tax=Ahrensia sp. R2A130 TaxID=744979 RepID=UPI0001E0B4A2|nr:Smr/MutS family protein [Ahrensia sp. R2A130]EFL89727.1 Smr domain-containing protein [Ahrensia sp. R2A130]